MEVRAAERKKREEMELFFGFLHRMGREKRDVIFRSHPVYWANVAAALSVEPAEADLTLEQFNTFLKDFREAVQKDHSKYKMHLMYPVLEELHTSGHLHPSRPVPSDFVCL
jgi:hypothetical protein